MWLINGSAGNQLAVSDRAVSFGDGCFTTLQLRKGRPLLWEYHAERLITTSRALLLKAPDLALIHQELCDLASLQGAEQLCGKVVLTRGSGARGYSLQGCEHPTRIVSIHDYPAVYVSWQHEGIVLAVCHGRIGHSSLLAGLKTLNRLEQVLLKAELEQRGACEGVVLDKRGIVVEGVTANLFWRHDSVVYTPDLQGTGIKGVMRAWVMATLAKFGIECREVQAGLPELMGADELFMTNALMEIVPVRGIEDVRYNDHSLARRLQATFTQTA